METLGKLHQMHMHTHPSMFHPEIMSSSNTHANIQGQQPKSLLLYRSQCCLPLPPWTSLAQSHAGPEREKSGCQTLPPRTYALCPWSSNLSVKAGVNSAKGTEDSRLDAHCMGVANISCPRGAKKTA